MPTNASIVGPVQFPVDASEPNTPLRDPTATVLLHLAAHWLNFGLADKLKSMQPQKVEAVPTDDTGCPVNLGEFDPGTTFVRRPLPALYCWCQRSRSEQFTMVKWLRTAEYHMRYYFRPLTVPKGRGARSGLLPDVDRLLHRMADEKRHQTFPPAAVDLKLQEVGISLPLNCSIEVALCLRSLTLDRSIFGVTWEEAGQQSSGETISRNLGGGAEGGVQRGFPTLHCVWIAKEEVGSDQVDPVADETPDLVLKIKSTTGEGEGHIDFMDRNLQAPDGTDDLCQKDEF